MANPDQSIDPRLLSSAKQEFSAHGFEKASLQSICENARVTTGALYKRYKGKEELFAAVVADAVESMDAYASERINVSEQALTDAELLASWSMDESIMLAWFEILYACKDGFFLLLKCAAGTRYADYQHDWVNHMAEKTYAYYREAYERGLTDVMVSENEMHVLVSTYWTAIYEPFIHGYPWEAMEAHCKLICRLFHWHRVLGL